MPTRLAREASPYLRTAADQPVDWYPFGAEAFAKARELDRPILLDIGAVWCHWCHVMDHESYESEETARLINQLFVAVKVDRDERPDVDARYQKAVQAISGQGGWPLTAFLTPEGEVFFGGTYFPPRDAHGRPGFPRVLSGVAEFYRADPAKAREQATHIREHLARLAGHGPAAGDVSDALPQEVVHHALAELDSVNGGFGGAPKFPHTSAIDLLLRRAARTESAALRNAVLATLDGMARGGVRDHVGGGFHRYGVDAKWIVPHFEKMLYDNAGLLGNYARAWQLWQRPEDRAVADGIVGFLRDVLQQPGGGFGGSQDADTSAHDDGDYFTWTVAEAAAVLDGDELKVARIAFDIDERGEMHHDPARNVLWRAADVDAIAAGLARTPAEVESVLAAAVAKLRAARAQRAAPFVDPTIYANWNGMAASALLDYAGATGDAEAQRLGLRAIDRLLAEAWDPARGFAHALGGAPGEKPTARGWDLLDDQAHMGWALCDAHVATGEARYAEAAAALARILASRFFDGAGFRDHARGDGEAKPLADAERPITDSPTPSANSVAIRFLLRVGQLTDDEAPTKTADAALRAFAGAPARYGLFAAGYALAVDERLTPPPKVTLVGEPAAVAPLLAAARAAYAPGLVVVRKERQGAVKPPAAIPCFGDRCLAPVADAASLGDVLRRGTP